ncbi:metallophosphoesterase [Streptomyces sp. NPDC094149]|uniref:metallophosphoesterase family protein n=1 Tax=Streptomyces sp. NPDC094149 TaxID=3155079 RepID=UPI003322FDC6
MLQPLEEIFARYSAVLLPVGTWEHDFLLQRFAREAAYAPGHGLLVLIPNLYSPEANVRILDPGDGVADALQRRNEWPGAIFSVRGENSFFVPFDEAYRAVAELRERDLLSVLDDARDRAAKQAAVAGRAHRRLLHLSDLHLGARQTDLRRTFLRSAVADIARSGEKLHRIVITGDLFDQPFSRHREQYTHFVNELSDLTQAEPIVVPGNHDQRIMGNKLGMFGNRRRQLIDLRWNRGPVHDEEAGIVFLCFDSSRTGTAARGGVGTDQLVDVASGYDAKRRISRYDDCLRIAVLHHHPYPYPQKGEVPVADERLSGRRWRPNRRFRERLLEMEDAEQFLAWCAARDVSLVLHGHRHRPRMIPASIKADEAPFGRHALLTVGCGTSLGAGGAPLSFNVIDWNPDAGNWSVVVMMSANDARGFRRVAIQAAPARDEEDW